MLKNDMQLMSGGMEAAALRYEGYSVQPGQKLKPHPAMNAQKIKIKLMESFEKKIEVRWSDLDPNFHVLHSKYYDFGAYCRMAFLTENGLTAGKMLAHHIGPVLFREECLFKKEITFGDEVRINFMLEKLSSDFGKWTMLHEIYINGDTLSALITAEGAWIDTHARKTTLPPREVIDLFEMAPKTSTFTVFERNKK